MSFGEGVKASIVSSMLTDSSAISDGGSSAVSGTGIASPVSINFFGSAATDFKTSTGTSTGFSAISAAGLSSSINFSDSAVVDFKTSTGTSTGFSAICALG